jgi:hypothetical protein
VAEIVVAEVAACFAQGAIRRVVADAVDLGDLDLVVAEAAAPDVQPRCSR